MKESYFWYESPEEIIPYFQSLSPLTSHWIEDDNKNETVKIRMPAATWILEGNVEQHLQSSQVNDWCPLFDVGNMLNAVRRLSYPISMTNI